MATPYQTTVRRRGRALTRPSAGIAASILLALGCVDVVEAQCAPGDIIWISSAVNANVGTGVGGGGTGSQCALRTVGGAVYNSTISPFGLQAGFDCACPGDRKSVV